MIVRPAVHADAQAMTAWHAEAFDRPWSAREILNFIATGAECAVAEDAGFILWRTTAGEAEILTLAVGKDARRKGAGRALVDAALAGAAAQGAQTLFLEVADDNAAAIALYRAAGFEQTGRRKDYYRREGGEMRDALIFARALNSAAPLGLS